MNGYVDPDWMNQIVSYANRFVVLAFLFVAALIVIVAIVEFGASESK